MTHDQWEILLAVIRGERVEPLPVGLIIDSPWLPNWAGMSLLDYFASEQMWFDANMKAIREFPEIMFLPGFWSEYGMCTEPSAFGARCTFWEDEFPFADKTITDFAQVASLEKPDPRIHGLPPMMLKRLKLMQPKIEAAGHAIRFAVARGPMNVASFLTGQTELLMAMYTDTEAVERLMTICTDFLIDWIGVQVEPLPASAVCFCWTTSSVSSARTTSRNSPCRISSASTTPSICR
jgi:uroporphyrinogen-III decarboxylase